MWRPANVLVAVVVVDDEICDENRDRWAGSWAVGQRAVAAAAESANQWGARCRAARELMTSERWRVPASRLDRLVAAAGVFITAESAVGSISEELGSHMTDIRVAHLGVASVDLERVRAASGARGASESANVVVHIVRTDLADRLDDERVREVITAVLLGTSEDARVRTAAMKHLSDCLAALTTRGRA